MKKRKTKVDERRLAYGLTARDRRVCERCIYRCKLQNDIYCDYLLVTGHPRMTESWAGTDCKFFVKGDAITASPNGGKDISCTATIKRNGKKRNRRVNLDEAIAMRMWRDGKMDVEIARLLDVSPESVGRWRHSRGLSVNRQTGVERKGKAVEGCLVGTENWVRFKSISSAAREIGGCCSAISDVCRGKGLSHRGMKWRYVNEFDG